MAARDAFELRFPKFGIVIFEELHESFKEVTHAIAKLHKVTWENTKFFALSGTLVDNHLLVPMFFLSKMQHPHEDLARTRRSILSETTLPPSNFEPRMGPSALNDLDAEDRARTGDLVWTTEVNFYCC